MEKFIPILKALADETRYKIISLLLTHDLCVGALANRLHVSKAAVSQHLQVLRKSGLVSGEKRGYWTHYAVQKSTLKQIAGELDKMTSRSLPMEGTCLREVAENTIIEERGGNQMCKDCCEHPEKLKGKPGDCTPELVKECHGDTKGHSCETEKK